MYRPEKHAGFDDLLLRRERIFGFVWLPMHMAVLPLLLGVILMFIKPDMDENSVNTVYYVISFAAVLIGFWHFLKEGFNRFVERFSYCCMIMVLAYFIQLMLSGALTAITSVTGELPTPNNDAIGEMANMRLNPVIATAVLMAPIVEECVFRGALFGTIARKSRILGYVVTVVVFSLYHVWQFAVVCHDWSMLLGAFSYIPLTVAITFCYDRTETIWTPIFFHMFINSAALAFMVSGG